MKIPDPFSARAARPRIAFDPRSITDTIQRSLASAGLDTSTGPMKEVTDTIERALDAAGLFDHASRPSSPRGRTIEGTAREVRTERAPHPSSPPAELPNPGQFLTRAATSAAGTLTYKLYIPARCAESAREGVPLIVMLHGCQQSPDDFAAGTRMNTLAERHGFLVAYPGQSRNANGSNCWNWFKPENHARDGDEPSLIAAVVHHVTGEYAVDRRRVFIAGLSAGGAMAVILGETYPELFAAVGVHSGLPYAAAHDVASAYAAMSGGTALSGMSHLGGKRRMRRPAPAMPSHPVPTIVFHGDADATVNARNGAEIADQATKAVHASLSNEALLHRRVERDCVGRRTYERTVLSDSAGRPVVEQWLLQGAGHAWSGGFPGGSFTDPDGPDASEEMIRFFLAQLPAA